MTVVPIVVVVVVSPGPVFFLFFGAKGLEIAIAIAMILLGPAMVIDDFVVIPDVVVSVVRIVDAIGMMLGASDSGQRRRESSRKQQRSNKV